MFGRFIKTIVEIFDPPIYLKDYKSPFLAEILEEKPIVNVKKENKSIFRPTSFKDYIGQEEAKAIIKSYILGTKKRNKIFPHTLIHGPAGCGKTTLIKILANELKLEMKEIVGRGIFDISQIVELCMSANGGIVFIDEVHAMPREMVESLYTIMEDFTYDGSEIEPFILAGATTELGELIKDRRPFVDRFKIKIELEDYLNTDIAKIIKQYQKKVFPEDILTIKDYNKLARNSRLTPRRGINLLESAIYASGNVDLALKNNKIIDNGYTRKDLLALRYISSSSSGVGLESVSSYLGTSKDNYCYEIEPWLLKNNLITRTARGRKITDLGFKMINKLEKVK